MGSRNPSTWDEYEQGGSPRGSGSTSPSGNRSVQFEDDDSPLGRSVEEYGQADVDEEVGNMPRLRRRRSSIPNRLAALTDVGGVNSIRSFKRSWQRAAGFAEVIPQRPAFMFAPDQEPLGAHPDAIQYGRSDVEAAPASERQSLLRQHFEALPRRESLLGRGEGAAGEAPGPGPGPGPRPDEEEAAVARSGSSSSYREREQKALDGGELSQAFRVGSHGSAFSDASIFAVPPHLATPPLMAGSYGALRDYGTVRSDAGGPGGVSSAQAEQAAALLRQQQETGATVPDGEIEPILVKEVEQDGKIMLTVEGQSTLPQTVFNSINVLIGVGLLSLPRGFKYAGWICGMAMLFLCAAVTAYTARLLARCMDLDPSLITFSDIAFISYGRNARIATSILFTLELLAACVALIVLFADSMDGLFPDVLSIVEWKMLCSLVLIPLNFLPLRLLSFTSVVGILSCLSIVLIMLVDGFIKPDSPGSLIQPAQTYLFPANWLTLPLSFGLLMSPWGGHGVFPNIYRDMRHPYKYAKAVKVTFSFTYLLDVTTAVAGLLMFGDEVRDEITSNILKTTGYPRALTFLMCAFIAIIPLTKIPLNARPIVSTVELLLGLQQQPVVVAAEDSPLLVDRSVLFRRFMKVAVRVAVILFFLAISILFPAFDSIMAFMGSALCYTICVTLPIAFYLKLFSHDISIREQTVARLIMTLSTALSIVGTVWAFLPKSLIGAE